MLEANSDCYGKVMIWTCSALKNDRLNFSFVKDTYVDGEKLARNGRKTDIYFASFFFSLQKGSTFGSVSL